MNQMNNFQGNMMGQQMGMGMPMQQMPAYGIPVNNLNGMVYNQPAQQPKFTNPLGRDLINKLLKEGNGAPRIEITEEDYHQAICTHRNPATNEHTTYPIANGKTKCKICGAEWHMVEDVTEEDITQCAENLWDVMNTAKVMWLDVPDKIAQENFQILAVISKIPQLWKIAQDSLQRYNGNMNMSQMSGQPNNFNLLNQLVGGYNNYGMGMGMAAPMMGQQQMQYDPNMAMGMGMNPMAQAMTQNAPGLSNGFGYTNPNQMTNLNPAAVQQPQVQQQAMPQQSAQPSPAAPSDNVRVSETLSVN